MPTYTFEHIDEDGDEVQHILPGKWEVCPRCHGNGTRDHPAFENGFTQSDFDEDPDFREEYLAGRYDVPCSECKGRCVVCRPDEDALTNEQKQALEAYREELRIEAQERAWERRNRAMGIEY